MQQLKTTIAVGSIIQERYRVEACLGEGGFSTVYLVRDLEQTNSSTQPAQQAGLFALKELRNQDKQDRQRFLLEGEILMKLHHYALPHIYSLFEDETRVGLFLLLEYIAGPNLETLRRQQPAYRFPLAQVLTIMQPIVASVTYLHHQSPPIIHRDIKPSNIVIAQSSDKTVLVDFGIAKEYETDATTTAIRHCTPGYAAPEQYSGYGTDPRTDIYGLAATCYALLTGSVPADAFLRTTTMVSKNSDPLRPAHTLVPELPTTISTTLARAMSIGQEQRFSTIEEFWQALQGKSETDSPELSSTQLYAKQTTIPLSRQKYAPLRGKPSLFLLLIILVTIGMSIFLGLQSGSVVTNHSTTLIHRITTLKKLAISPTPAPSVQSYTHISHIYKGTIYNLQTNIPTPMSLINVQQQNERIAGHFLGLSYTGIFTGVLDTSQHIFFTVAGTATQPSIFFEGTVRTDHNLAGNYCNLDQAGQCTGGYGLWTLASS